MNVNVGGTGGWRNPSISALRISQVDTPDRTAIFMDGCFKPGKGYDIRVGETGFMPTPMHPPSRYKNASNPADSVNVVFVDGHVELRKIRTIPIDFKQPFWAAKEAP
jgi:prepilin-type processing-associated H-X9-DG protein